MLSYELTTQIKHLIPYLDKNEELNGLTSFCVKSFDDYQKHLSNFVEDLDNEQIIEQRKIFRLFMLELIQALKRFSPKKVFNELQQFIIKLAELNKLFNLNEAYFTKTVLAFETSYERFLKQSDSIQALEFITLGHKFRTELRDVIICLIAFTQELENDPQIPENQEIVSLVFHTDINFAVMIEKFIALNNLYLMCDSFLCCYKPVKV